MLNNPYIFRINLTWLCSLKTWNIVDMFSSLLWLPTSFSNSYSFYHFYPFLNSKNLLKSEYICESESVSRSVVSNSLRPHRL